MSDEAIKAALATRVPMSGAGEETVGSYISADEMARAVAAWCAWHAAAFPADNDQGATIAEWLRQQSRSLSTMETK